MSIHPKATTNSIQVPESRVVNAVAYVRVSVDKSIDKKIKTQILIIQQYIEEHPELILATIYIDNAFWGTNFDRPEFKVYE